MSTTSNEKICMTCEQQLPLAAFHENRNHCKACRHTASMNRCKAKENDDKSDGKECSKCHVLQPHSAFEPTRKQCRTCRSAIKNATTQRKYEQGSRSTNDVPRELRNSGPCTTCNTPFNAETFVWRTDRLCFAAKCKPCYNKCGYHTIHRNKQRDENEEEYLKHNAEIARNARDRVSTECAMNNIATPAAIYRASVIGKISTYRTSAKGRGLLFDESEEAVNIFKSHFIAPCYYCGVTPDMRNGELNGLDRICNDQGYTTINVVPCCSPCNMMRGTMTMDHFKEQIRNIYTHLYITSEEKERNVERNIVLLNAHCKKQTFIQTETETETETETNNTENNLLGIPPTKRPRAFYVPQGNQMAFYNANTMRIGYITGSLKEAGELIGIKSSSAHQKIKNANIIWIKPHWKVRKMIEGDEVHLSEIDNFQLNLNTLNASKCLLHYHVISPQGNIITCKDIVSMAALIRVNKRTVQDWFAAKNYKESNVIIDITSKTSIQYAGYQLCSSIN